MMCTVKINPDADTVKRLAVEYMHGSDGSEGDVTARANSAIDDHLLESGETMTGVERFYFFSRLQWEMIKIAAIRGL